MERINNLKSLFFDFEINLGKPYRVLYHSHKIETDGKKKKALAKLYVDEKCQRLISQPDVLYKEIISLYREVMNQQNLDKLTDKMAEF